MNALTMTLHSDDPGPGDENRVVWSDGTSLESKVLDFDTHPVTGGVGMTNVSGATWHTFPTTYVSHYSLWDGDELFSVGVFDFYDPIAGWDPGKGSLPVTAGTTITVNPGDIKLSLTVR